jgi:hypothetical protein
MPIMVFDGFADLASPACFAHEASDAYMGFAPKDELIAVLNELLEAERAGARVTAETSGHIGDAAVRALVRDIEHDEARWCAMLSAAVQGLGGTPSKATGAFFDKAMAIADIDERLAFLNRGQGWVVRKLNELLPRVRNERLGVALRDMLASHETNIAKVDAQTGS